MLFRDDLKATADKARAKVFSECREDADVIVTTDPTHVGYLCGYRSILLDADRTYRCAAVVARDETILVTGASDAAPALEVLRDPARIYRYGLFYVESSGNGPDYSAWPKAESTFLDALRSAIKSTVRPHHVVGLDCAGKLELQEVEGMLDSGSFDARANILKARSTKFPEEIDKIRHAAEITEKGMQNAFLHAKEGVTELELSTIISAEIIAGGGIPRFVVVTSGGRSALADAYATKAKLCKGDLLRLDVGCTVEGYWADTARTAVVGEPSREQQQRYDALLKGELAQLEIARPGVTAGELFNVAVTGVRGGALPNYKRTHCGHGIGLSAHEFPTLNVLNQDVKIAPGMVLCVETPYYEIGWGGMMVEDMIVVQERGIECLTRLPRELRSL
jgi:Xaa-Pro aminopeptidase